ncbi:MAG: RNA-binding cell elongation regulator Jag/EloR [[Bacteroides] pectinophilus]|nr:RNA-binding cell elongation regulator Jag/EloR [[Bacteroides] pectinophilus]
MANVIEITGKSVEDAFMNAIVELETTSDNIGYDVIDKGSNGILGFGSRPAKIKAWVKSEVEAEKKAEEEKTAEVKSTEAAAPAANSDKADVTSDNSDEVLSEPHKKMVVTCDVDKVIRDFLDNMFKAMDMDVNIDIKINEEEGCVNVELSGDEMGLLIGKRGQTLDSIQYLVSLVVNKENEKYMRVKVDTEDYRKRRKETLESLAKNIAYKVKRSKRPVSLEPMNPYERRIIHSALQNDKFVATRSEGEEPFRHVIVYLKNDYRSGGRDNYKKDYGRN